MHDKHTCEYTHAICWLCVNNTWRDELISRDDKIQKLESATAHLIQHVEKLQECLESVNKCVFLVDAFARKLNESMIDDFKYNTKICAFLTAILLVSMLTFVLLYMSK